jgi:hypothetical protein
MKYQTGDRVKNDLYGLCKIVAQHYDDTSCMIVTPTGREIIVGAAYLSPVRPNSLDTGAMARMIESGNKVRLLSLCGNDLWVVMDKGKQFYACTSNLILTEEVRMVEQVATTRINTAFGQDEVKEPQTDAEKAGFASAIKKTQEAAQAAAESKYLNLINEYKGLDKTHERFHLLEKNLKITEEVRKAIGL